MENALIFLQTYFPALFIHKYIFLFLGGAIEGLNTMVLAGFLVSVGSLKLLPVFTVLVLGYTINGYLWYLVGYFGGSKPIDKWVRPDIKGKQVIETVERYFHKYSGRAIMITKFTFALTIATLIMSGSLRYDLKKFSFYNFLGSIGWVAITMFIGFFFGESYQFFFIYLRNFTFFIIFLVSAAVLVYIIKVAVRSKFINSLVVMDRLKQLGERFREKVDEFLSDSK